MRVVRLVKKAKKGSKEALLQLITEQQDEYYRLALKYMGNSHDAMDAMEEMIVSLYRNIQQLEKNDAFYSWSKTILVNQCKQMLRKVNKVTLIDNWEAIESHSDPSAVQNPFEQTEQRMDIQDLLLRVNAQQREAIELKYFHDLDYETIAMMTQTSIGTVKSRVFNGLKKMREQARGGFDE
ncbi:RNA polymerase ECF-type sigma factor [Sporosarcina newyorkensis 2681]|uniref:RNA polymerase ECF-type sigma factor n=1 Tax=Sporosarcina newyorkensis 2681 TaxID=1027292 RepID=F9DUX0_9BACL|nr:RNA polymerase sigma factor [Sporosarcina newyorkensis]EGQ24019.1 RNA polymerase ECF-type sigma factor [Sporosarcina newyorkensis 2681]